MTALDTLVTAAETPAPELPRMTCAQVFAHHGRIGSALELAVDAYQKASKTTQADGCGENLKMLVKQCEAVIKLATRMLEANR